MRVLAWILLAMIVVVTLGPIGVRPVTGASVALERSFAFMVLGLIFALAYPRHLGWVALLILCATLGLELLQNLRPDRHGRFLHAIVKCGGGMTGLTAGWLLLKLQLAIPRRSK
jgi:hypothetical protein